MHSIQNSRTWTIFLPATWRSTNTYSNLLDICIAFLAAWWRGIANFEKYRVVLMIRDPRDVLVSRYYSLGYSHTPPSKHSDKYGDFLKERKRIRQITVDEYVVGGGDRLCLCIYQRCVQSLTLPLSGGLCD